MSATDDLGLFGPGSVTWRVHGEPILMLGGVRALFLQGLHPRAIAGVVQNSGYQTDPWGRLVRTINYVATTIYGTTAEAEAAGRRVRAVHARMSAVDPTTRERFRVDEPDLLRWVHVTEVDSYANTARRAGVRLHPAEWDRYWDEQRRRAALVGLDPASVPGSTAQAAAYFRAVRPELAMTRDAAETLLFLSVPPPPWARRSASPGPASAARHRSRSEAQPLDRVGSAPEQALITPAGTPALNGNPGPYGDWGWRRLLLDGVARAPFRAAMLAVTATAFGLLPAWARRLYGMPGLPTTDLTAGLSARTLRLALAALPHRVYEGPLYRAAMARAARVTGPDQRVDHAVAHTAK